MSKSIGRVFGTGSMSPYGYETDYMQYLQGYNPYNYEQTLQNMMPSAVNVNVQPDYQLSVQTTATPSEREKTADTFSEKPEDVAIKQWRELKNLVDRLNQMNAYKESLYQPYNGYEWNTNTYDVPQTATNDYTVNTENLLGKPSSYFQNNNSASDMLNQNSISDNSINYDNYSMRQNLENNIKREKERQLHQSLMSYSDNSQITPIPSGKPLTSQEAAYMYTPTHPDYGQIGSLEFDGQNLVWLQNGQPVKYYQAQSGHNDFQSAKYTNVANDGPIPEGEYLLAQGTGQDYQESLLKKLNRWAVHQNNKLLDYISINDWTATPAGWGHQRIPIQALPNTNTFGRHSMYVHGGDNGFGSSGCIDLERGMSDFYNDWLNYNGNLPLKVKYPKGW